MCGPDRNELFAALRDAYEEAKSYRTSCAVVVCSFLQDGEIENARHVLSRNFEPADKRFHELLERMKELTGLTPPRMNSINGQEQTQ